MNLDLKQQDEQFLELAQALTECNGVGFMATIYTPFGTMLEIRSETVMTCIIGELATHLKEYAGMLRESKKDMIDESISPYIHELFPIINAQQAKEKMIGMLRNEEIMMDIFSLPTSESSETNKE